jgi:hypothetical protein
MLKRCLRDFGPLVGLWLAATLYYVFVVSAGHFTSWHVWSAFYDEQAQGFLAGHLYLPEAPSRALLALKNPLDLANMPHWRWDHSLFQGHLYIYWGLVPAFIVAAIKAVFHPAGVPDNSLTFAFCVIRLIAGTLLIRSVARGAAHRPPRWVVALGMIVFAVAHPTPYALARAGIYEAAIMGGVGFMIAALYGGYRALGARGDGAAATWLAVASLSFGLAGGSRLNLIPTVAVLAVLTAVWRWRQLKREGADSPPRVAGVGAAALLPVGAIGIALLVLNYLRFGSLTETGHSYAMTYPYFLPGLRFVPPDVLAYTIAPPEWTCWFPFISSPWNTMRVVMPSWLPVTWPVDHFSIEPSIGFLVVTPFAVLAGIAGVVALGRLRVRRIASASTPTLASTIASAAASALGSRMGWLWVVLLIYVAGALPLLILNVTTMRYQNDFASGVLLLAIFGGWRLLAAPASARGRRAIAWLYGVLAVTTIVAGVLLGFTGYFKHFEQHNPPLTRALIAKLSFCR